MTERVSRDENEKNGIAFQVLQALAQNERLSHSRKSNWQIGPEALSKFNFKNLKRDKNRDLKLMVKQPGAPMGLPPKLKTSNLIEKKKSLDNHQQGKRGSRLGNRFHSEENLQQDIKALNNLRSSSLSGACTQASQASSKKSIKSKTSKGNEGILKMLNNPLRADKPSNKPNRPPVPQTPKLSRKSDSTGRVPSKQKSRDPKNSIRVRVNVEILSSRPRALPNLNPPPRDSQKDLQKNPQKDLLKDSHKPPLPHRLTVEPPPPSFRLRAGSRGKKETEETQENGIGFELEERLTRIVQEHFLKAELDGQTIGRRKTSQPVLNTSKSQNLDQSTHTSNMLAGHSQRCPIPTTNQNQGSSSKRVASASPKSSVKFSALSDVEILVSGYAMVDQAKKGPEDPENPSLEEKPISTVKILVSTPCKVLSSQSKKCIEWFLKDDLTKLLIGKIKK